jgi:hypothetical protein
LRGVAPSEGPVGGGNTVALSVDGLDPAAQLFVSGRPAAFTRITGGLTTVMPSASAHGSVDLAVTNPDGQTSLLAAGYVYLNGSAVSAPSIVRVQPSRALPAGGGTVVVRGAGFLPGAQVLIGGAPAGGVTVARPDVITCVAPPGASGAADVTVQNPDGGLIRLTGGFSFLPSAAPAPTLSAVAPSAGPVTGGTVAVLSGSGFDADAVLVVGGRPAEQVERADDHTLTAHLPEGNDGTVDVTVTNHDGQSATAHAAYTATAAPPGAPPRIHGVTPAAGALEGGAVVLITSEGLSFSPGAQVIIGGRPATTSPQAGALAAILPAGVRPGAVDVAVTNPDGQSDVLSAGFVYYVAAPLLSGVTPACGPAGGGTDLILAGRGFRPGAAATVGGAPLAGLVRLDAGTLRGTTSAGGPGPVDVLVVNQDGQQDTLGGAFTFTDAAHPCPGVTQVDLTLQRILPTSGPLTGGTVITLMGSGFTAGATVRVAGVAAGAVTLLGSGALTFTLPASAATGPADVTLRLPDGRQKSLPASFTYFDPQSLLPAPTVAAVSPSVGPATGGTLVQLSGSGYAPGSRVFFGATEAGSVTAADAAHLSLLVPSGLSGAVDVTVLNPDGKSATLPAGFAYYPAGVAGAPPLPLRVSPSSGSTSGPTEVTVSGFGFQPGALLFVGGIPAGAPHLLPDGSLVATVAPQGAGTADLVVTNPDGQSATLAGAFSFRAPPPVLLALSPSRGPLAGGRTTVVTGSGLLPGDGLSFGGTPATVKFLDASALLATLPAHAAAVADVSLLRGGAVVATLPGAYTFDPAFTSASAPALISLEPATGPLSGGTVLWLTGAGLQPGAQLYFGAAPAVRIQLADAAHAVVQVPPGAVAGAVDVTLVNPDGQAGAALRGFAYVSDSLLSGLAPRLTSVTPADGPEATDTTAIFSGANLVAGELVLVGTARAAGVRLLSPALLQATIPHQPAGVVDVAVTHPDGRSSLLPAGFTFLQRPTLVSAVNTASPSAGASGPTAGGTAVTLAGTGFRPGATVTFGGAPATAVVVASSTILSCVAPAGVAGAADLQLINPDGQTVVLAAGWRYVPPPLVAAIAPAVGPASGGTYAVITGSAFSPGATVTVGAAPAPATFGSDGSLVVQAPPGNLGVVPVTVRNPDGQTGSVIFTYTGSPLGPPPTLSTVSPATGPDTGGTLVELGGGGFAPGAIGIVGGQALSAATLVRAGALTGFTGAAAIGAATVAVTNPDGQSAVLPAAFAYVDHATLGPPPVVDHLVPGQALAPGGTAVALLGSAFSTAAAPRVYFQGIPAALADGSTASQLNVVTPAAQPGLAAVAVVNPDGQTSVRTGAFTFLVPPPVFDPNTPLCVVTGATCTSPPRGPTVGGTTVQIQGTYFQPPVQVFFGSALASVVSASTSQIVVTTPAGVAGYAGVRIVNQDGQSAPPPGAPGAPVFYYQPPPVLSQVSPPSGSPGGGDIVTLRGQFFSGDAATLRVKFGNAPAAVQGAPTANVIQVQTPSSLAAGAETVGIQIINDDGQSTSVAGAFIYLPPPATPVVNAVTPSAGPLQGANTVTLLGQHFQYGARVFFGAAEAGAVAVASDAALSCVVPGAAAPATVAVRVLNPDTQEATLASAYTYVAGPSPASLSVGSVSPAIGSTGGGTAIVIAGTGFHSGAVATLVPRDGSTCPAGACTLRSLQVLGPTAMVATTPPLPVASAAGYDLLVQNPGGSSALLSAAWTYGDKIRRFVPYGLRLPMESHAGKLDRGFDSGTLSGMSKPGWWGTVGDFTRSQAGVTDVFLGSNGGRAPRLYQGDFDPVLGSGGKPRVFRDLTATNLRNADGTPVKDNCCGTTSPFQYQPYLPRTIDVDGDGRPDVVFWNDSYSRNALTIFRNQGGAMVAALDSGSPWTGSQNATDWVGGTDPVTGRLVDLNLDGAPDFVMVNNGMAPMVALSCGGSTVDFGTGLRVPKPASPRCVTAGATPLIGVATSIGAVTISAAQTSGFTSTNFAAFMAPAGRWLVDDGGNQEVVAITAATATSFSAVFTKAHAAGVPMAPVIETMAHASAPVAAGATVTLTLDSIQGFALSDFWLVADPGSGQEERVHLVNPVVSYPARTVTVRLAQAHPADFLLTVRNPFAYAYDTTRFNAAGAANAVVAGDLDGDGDVDVITGNQTEGLKVFLSNAADLVLQGRDPIAFSLTTSAAITAAAFPGGVTGGNVRALSLFDVNGDGLADLLVGYRDNLQERLFINKGAGQLVDEALAMAPGSTCLSGAANRLPVGIKDSVVRYDVRDLDGNGAPDVLAWIQVNGVSGSFQRPLRLWLNDGRGCLVGQPADPNTGGGLVDSLFPPALGVQQTWAYALGDLNKDGLPDLIAGFEGAQTREYVNLAGVFTDKTAANLPAATSAASSNVWWRNTTGGLLVDVNGDGFPDLLTSQTNRDLYQAACSGQPCYGDPDGGLHLYRNDQQGNFPSDDTLAVLPTATLPGPQVVSALPIVSSAMDAAPLYPGGPLAIIVASNTRYSSPRPAVLQGTPFDNPVGAHRLLVSNGDGTFRDATYPHLPTSGQIFTLASAARFVDLDNDGYVDIVIGDVQNGSIMIWKGTPDGFFIDVTATALPGGLPGGGRVWQVLPANLDNDNLGRTDLLVVRDANGSRLLINHSDVVNHTILLTDETVPANGQPLQRLPNPPPNGISAAIANFDCSGGLDIFMLDPSGGEHLYTNGACLPGGSCGFFNDVTALPGVFPPESRGTSCVGSSCGGNVGLVPLQFASANTDLLILRTSDGYSQTRRHRLLQNTCGSFSDVTLAPWDPIPPDDDVVQVNGVVAGDVFGHVQAGDVGGAVDLVIFDTYGPRVYRNAP